MYTVYMDWKRRVCNETQNGELGMADKRNNKRRKNKRKQKNNQEQNVPFKWEYAWESLTERGSKFRRNMPDYD